MTSMTAPVEVRRAVGLVSALSPREWAVLAGTVRGSRHEVADALGIAFHTVKFHLNNAYRKLGVETDKEAYLALGWLRVPEDGEFFPYRSMDDLKKRAGALADEAEALAAGLRGVA